MEKRMNGINGPYIHILINHFPIILSLLGAAAAVLALFRRRRMLWLYAVATLTLAGLSAYPTMLSGHEAEHSIENMPYASRRAIHDHEEAGDLAMWVLIFTGVVSAYAWWRTSQSAPRDETFDAPNWLRILVALGGIASAATAARAAKLSDPILHYSPGIPHPAAPGIPAVAPAPSIPATLPAPVPASP
jgi:uncharacterized membrane protein